MSKPTPELEIVSVYFRGPVHVGGYTLENWTARTQTQIMQNTKIEDRGAQGLLLRYDAGDLHHEITVPLHKVDQITRAVKK